MKNLLENLFGAKAKVLRLFFQRPALVLSAEDVGRKIGLKTRTVKPMISHLVKLGVLKKANSNPRSRISK